MKPLRIAIVAGEESGDQLGADLIRALKLISGRDVELIGIGGRHLQSLGLQTMADPERLAIMGVTAVLRDLPGLVAMIGSTARAIADAEPDCFITIDSPAFNLRVSKKVRALAPRIPIVKYVCPSVWAWGAGRAARMKPYIDHVLCILPFEPDVLRKLGGPEGTYVGHRMTHDEGLLRAAGAQASRRGQAHGEPTTLLVLPGSRSAEVRGLLAPFGNVVKIMAERDNALRVVLPVADRVAPLVEQGTAKWPVKPQILRGTDAKWQAFGRADAAIAASGTVLLELALAGVPAISCYRLDRIMQLLRGMISTWSAALPNIIADQAIIPEYYDDAVYPPMLARVLEGIGTQGHAREAQLEGFDRVRKLMKTDRPSGQIAAEVVMKTIGNR